MEDVEESKDQKFQWPSKGDIEKIMTSEDVRIEKIEVWQNGLCSLAVLHSIKIYLSNGIVSELFGPKKREKKHLQQILIIKNDIREVGIKCNQNSLVFKGIKFKDKDRKIIAKWEIPSVIIKSFRVQKIPQDETVIGVYGQISENCNCLRSFGFVTVKRN